MSKGKWYDTTKGKVYTNNKESIKARILNEESTTTDKKGKKGKKGKGKNVSR